VARHLNDDPIRSIAQLEEPNRRRLYDLVAASTEPVGRDAAAARLGISRGLAAFHLDRLVAAGLLTTEYRRLHGRSGPGAGRPAKLYRRAPRSIAVSVPPRRYDVAAAMLAETVGGLGKRGVAALLPIARGRGRAEANRVAGPAGTRGTAAQPETGLVEALRGAGYQPDVAPDGSVMLRNCPYDALAVDHQDVTCRMSAAWAEGVVEGLGAPMSVALEPAPDRCCVVFRPSA
jgi:predicted ArsR family transcriptional regulator